MLHYSLQDYTSLRTIQNVVFCLQLIRRLQGQDAEVVGEEVPTTPKGIFQLLDLVIIYLFSIVVTDGECLIPWLNNDNMERMFVHPNL